MHAGADEACGCGDGELVAEVINVGIGGAGDQYGDLSAAAGGALPARGWLGAEVAGVERAGRPAARQDTSGGLVDLAVRGRESRPR